MATSKIKKTEKTAVRKSPLKKESSQRMTLGDLRNKVLDHKNKKRSLLLAGIIAGAILLYLLRGLLVAATVNGEPISRLSVVKDLETQGGKAVIDRMITRKLIDQEAEKKKIQASQEDVDKEVKKIEEQFKGQGQNLNDLLAAQGVNRERFIEEVKIQLLVERILGDQIKVSDQEFNDFLKQNEDLIKDEKDQDAAKKKLREQLAQQKLSQKYQEWIAELKKKAKIQYLVEYK